MLPFSETGALPLTFQAVCATTDRRLPLFRVMTISNDNTRHLTILNTYLRRVDLLCKLLSPVRRAPFYLVDCIAGG